MDLIKSPKNAPTGLRAMPKFNPEDQSAWIDIEAYNRLKNYETETIRNVNIYQARKLAADISDACDIAEQKYGPLKQGAESRGRVMKGAEE